MPPKIDFQVMATTLMGAVGDTFRTMCNEELSQNPTFESHPVDWLEKGRMKVSSYSKLCVSSYISYIYYYASDAHRKKYRPSGVVIVYVKDSGIMKLLPALGYSTKDFTNQDLVKDMVGEICNNIAGGVKNELSPLGFASLEISTPFNHKDIVPGGVVLPKKVKECHEVDISLWGSKYIIIDIALDI